MDEIHNLVSHAEVDRAVARLLDLAKQFDRSSLNDAILISSSHHNLKKEKKDRQLTREEAEVDRIRISRSILELVNEIVTNVAENSDEAEAHDDNN